MLGFSAISSRAISGSTFNLVGYAAAIAATGAITFSGSATWGQQLNGSATGRLIFSGSAVWSSLNALEASTSITFGGNPILRLAGRPTVFTAIPDRHEFTAQAERMTFNAVADNFTFRGMP